MWNLRHKTRNEMTLAERGSADSALSNLIMKSEVNLK
jgi:hypothetical protein